MIEENKNVEIPKKKTKNWALRIGLLLALVCIITLIFLYFGTKGITSTEEAFAIGMLTHLIVSIFIAPLLVIFLILIFKSLLLHLSINRKIKWLLIILVTIFILWLSVQVFYSDPNHSVIPVGNFFLRLAVSTNNEFTCPLIPMISDYYKNNCYLFIAVQKKDLSICEKAPDIYRIYCYEGVAKATGNELICEKIDCRNMPKEWCESVTGMSFEKDNCYFYVAEKRKDPSLCEKLNSSWRKEDCYRATK